jgi:hypothetical protein
MIIDDYWWILIISWLIKSLLMIIGYPFIDDYRHCKLLMTLVDWLIDWLMMMIIFIIVVIIIIFIIIGSIITI